MSSLLCSVPCPHRFNLLLPLGTKFSLLPFSLTLILFSRFSAHFSATSHPATSPGIQALPSGLEPGTHVPQRPSPRQLCSVYLPGCLPCDSSVFLRSVPVHPDGLQVTSYAAAFIRPAESHLRVQRGKADLWFASRAEVKTGHVCKQDPSLQCLPLPSHWLLCCHWQEKRGNRERKLCSPLDLLSLRRSTQTCKERSRKGSVRILPRVFDGSLSLTCTSVLLEQPAFLPVFFLCLQKVFSHSG